MLHLENFFEKSFALLLTTPKKIKKLKKHLTTDMKCGILLVLSINRKAEDSLSP